MITSIGSNYHLLKNSVEVRVIHLWVRYMSTTYGQSTGTPVLCSVFFTESTVLRIIKDMLILVQTESKGRLV